MKINLLEFFEETVVKNTDKTAVIDGNNSISFKDLDNRSDSLARFLHLELKEQNQPVAVFLPKNIDAVVSNIAIAKSGNAFMNLDIKTPTNRLANIIDLIKPAAIISVSSQSKVLNEMLESISVNEGGDVSMKVFLLDEIEGKLETTNHNEVVRYRENLIDTDPFCIINTSGSTGTPKGVALSHLNFLDFLYRSQEEFKFSDHEIIGSLSPLVFDIYVFELILLMSNSATMVLLPGHLAAFPAKLLQIMQENKVSFIFWVPTIMVNIANMGLLQKFDLSTLKLVWFAGEVFPTLQFNIWRKSLTHTKFANLYGPIETALDSIFYVVERDIPDDEPIPIGYAYKNTDILLLDENDNRVSEPGKEGEICVRGSSVALGYYNNPEKTAAAFVQNPLNTHYPERIYRTGDIAAINERGEIVFRGRKDSLVKHQGYRIELGEVEHVIVNTLNLVKNGCVVYDFKKKEIVLFYENPEELERGDFRKALSSQLPNYMIPTLCIHEPELKRNTNGKIDRLHYKERINV